MNLIKLINCPSCNNQCSPLAPYCPKCGHPFEGLTSKNTPDLKKELFSHYEEENNSFISNKWKYLTILIGIIAGGILMYLSVSVYQNKNVLNENSEINLTSTQNISPTPIPKGTLELKAAIIYKVGGVQPVAREKFYLLDKSLASILRDSGSKGKDENLINGFGIFSSLGSMEKEFAEIKKHIKYEGMTDFDGKVTIKDIECKNYFLFAVTQTRKGSAVWNMPIEVKEGKQSIILDQNNASFAL